MLLKYVSSSKVHLYWRGKLDKSRGGERGRERDCRIENFQFQWTQQAPSYESKNRIFCLSQTKDVTWSSSSDYKNIPMMTLCSHIIMKSTHALHIFRFMQFKRVQWLGVVLASATREVEHSSCIADTQVDKRSWSWTVNCAGKKLWVNEQKLCDVQCVQIKSGVCVALTKATNA